MASAVQRLRFLCSRSFARSLWVPSGPLGCGASRAVRDRAFATSAPHAEGSEEASARPGDPGSDVAGELADTGPRVYRRDKEEHQRTFRWGIGNAFRAQSKNRFMPVHMPHPHESVVRNDYYESENPNIVWEELNECWEVYWYEHNKLHARPFPVKKWGIERAKTEAYLFHESLQEAGRLHERTQVPSPKPGVFFDHRMQSWISLIWKDGRPQSRAYPASKYGLDGARALALAKVQDPVNGVLPQYRRRRAPVVPQTVKVKSIAA